MILIENIKFQHLLQMDDTSLDKGINRSSMGVVVSTHVKPDDSVADEDKSVYDWCQEGNTAEVLKILNRGVVGVDDKDSEVMAGQLPMVEDLCPQSTNEP